MASRTRQATARQIRRQDQSARTVAAITEDNTMTHKDNGISADAAGSCAALDEFAGHGQRDSREPISASTAQLGLDPTFAEYNTLYTANSQESADIFACLQDPTRISPSSQSMSILNPQLPLDMESALGQLSPSGAMEKEPSFSMDVDFAPSVDTGAIFPQVNMLDTNRRAGMDEPDAHGELNVHSGSIVGDLNMRLSGHSPDSTPLRDNLPPVLCSQPLHSSSLRSARSLHAAEQRRRNVMKHCFKRLEDMIPQGIQKRRSKADLLEGAVNELERLRHAEVAYRAHIHMLTLNLAQVSQQLACNGCIAEVPNAHLESDSGTAEQSSRARPSDRPLAPRTSKHE